MQLGELLASGRSADVYAIDDHWVLRRYRDGGDVGTEAAVLAHLAKHSYPVPRVRPTTEEGNSGCGRRTDLVMRRLQGPTLLRALEEGTITAAEGGRVLAALLTRLHTVPARIAADPAHRILHLDLHPDNVMMTPDGPVVIDWANAEEGAPGLDWCLSALILAQEAVTSPTRATLAHSVLARLLRQADPALLLGRDSRDHLTQAGERRAADPAMDGEAPQVLQAALALVRDLTPAEPG